MEALSAESEKVLNVARQEALGLRHEFTGTEHLLLGLLACDDDIAGPLLSRHGIVAAEVRAQVARHGVGGEPSAENPLPLTARAKQVLSLASNEAEVLEDDEVRPEHLLLGIIRQASGVAALVLHDMGVDLSELRAEVLDARTNSEMTFVSGDLGPDIAPFDQDEGPGEETGRFTRSALPSDGVLPLCPGCGRHLTETVATSVVTPAGSTGGRKRSGAGNVTLVYCGACGLTLTAR